MISGSLVEAEGGGGEGNDMQVLSLHAGDGRVELSSVLVMIYFKSQAVSFQRSHRYDESILDH